MTAKLSAADIADLAQFAEELADLSGATILPHFRERIAVHNKLGDQGFDPVTEADRAAEDVIRARINARHASHGVMGEVSWRACFSVFSSFTGNRVGLAKG